MVVETPSVIRTMSVLTVRLDDPEPGVVEFVQLDEDNDYQPDTSLPTVRMSQEQWDDLGNPGNLTIAIYPGDRQDLMESEDFPA